MSHKINTPVEALSSAIINGVGNTIATSALTVRNSTPEDLFVVRDDGTIEFKSFTFPTVDGTLLQSLVTDGLGNLTWGNPSSLEWIRNSINGYVYTRTATDRVGIGTSAPARKLEISNATATFIRATWTTASSNGGFELFESATKRGGFGAIGSTYVDAWRREHVDFQHWGLVGDLNFFVGAGSANEKIPLRIKNNGDIALGFNTYGAATPTARLHIKSSGDTSGSYALKIDSLLGVPLLSVRDDGYTFIGSYGRLWSNEAQGYAVFYPTTSSNNTFFYGNSNAAIITGSSTPFYFGSSGTVGPNDGVTAISNTFYAVPHGITYTFGRLVTQNNNTNAILGDIILRGHTSRDISTLNTIGGKVLIVGGNGASAFAGDASGGNVEIDGGTGYGTGTKGLVKIQGLTYPSIDGTASQAIITDGLGNLTFGAPSSAEWARDLINGILYPRTATDRVQILADGRSLLIGGSGISPSRYIQFRTEDATSVRIGMIPDNQGAMWIDTGSEKSFGIRVENGSSFGANPSTPDFFIRYGTRNVSIGAGISPSARLHVKSSGNTSATFAQKIENSSAINLFSIRDDGVIEVGSEVSSGLYNSNGTLRLNSPFDIRLTVGTTFLIFDDVAVTGEYSGDGITITEKGFFAPFDARPFYFSGGNQSVDQLPGDLKIKGGSAYSSAITNINGADLFLDGGTEAAGGTKGNVIIQGLTYPSVDGTSGQSIKTDGAGNLTFGSANSLAIQTVSANTALTSIDYTTLVDASGGAIVITLPAASNTGLVLNIKKIDASVNTVTLTPSGADTIDGAATKVISAQWSNVTIQSDGTNWYIL